LTSRTAGTACQLKQFDKSFRRASTQSAQGIWSFRTKRTSSEPAASSYRSFRVLSDSAWPGRLALVIVCAITDCGGNGDEQAIDATEAVSDCQVGEKPGYFVPASRPVELIGCVQLGVSGKRAELSVEEPKPGREGVCVNPAYGFPNESGLFIPGLCFKPRGRLFPFDNIVPSQGVSGYGYVVTGEAPPEQAVAAESALGQAEAAAFVIPGRLAHGTPRGYFILELPREAACEEIILRDESGGEERIPPRNNVCERARAA
jgi:hypothetical protein